MVLYVELGRQKDVAEALGISASQASRLYNDPGVHAAIMSEMEWQMTHRAAVGMSILEDLAENSEDENIRFRAAKELVSRGMGPIKEYKEHIHKHSLGSGAAQLMERIAELQSELGLSGGKVVEAEFEEVEEEKPSGSLVKKLPFRIA